MNFVHKLDPHSSEIQWTCKYKLRTSRLSKVIVWQTDTDTYTHTRQTDKGLWNYKPCCIVCATRNNIIRVVVFLKLTQLKPTNWHCWLGIQRASGPEEICLKLLIGNQLTQAATWEMVVKMFACLCISVCFLYQCRNCFKMCQISM